MPSQFFRLSLIVLLTITFLPATSQAVNTAISTVGRQSDDWFCRDNGTFDDPGFSSSFAACGGDVGNLVGAGSASAFATPGVVRATASFGFSGPTPATVSSSSRSAVSTAQVTDELTVTFPDDNFHYVVFYVTSSGSATAEGLSNGNNGTLAAGGLYFEINHSINLTPIISEGLLFLTPGNTPIGSFGPFSLMAIVQSGDTIDTILRLTAQVSVRGVGSASANFGNSAQVTVDVFTDAGLTNQLAPSQFSLIGETGLDYGTLTVPEPVSARPSLEIMKTPEGQLSLAWQSQPGVTYQVESSNDLTLWQPHGEPHEGDGTELLVDLPTDQTKAFFRLRIQ